LPSAVGVLSHEIRLVKEGNNPPTPEPKDPKLAPNEPNIIAPRDSPR